MITPASPQSPLGQRLCEIFNVYRWHWIYKLDGCKTWETETRYPLEARSLWQHWQDAAMQIGVRFGHKTQYAMLDIDKGSQYLNEAKLRDLYDALETIGINRIIKLRSSWSGGLHLYIPLPEAVATFNLACALKNCLKAFDFTVAAGQLEIFPNTKAYGRSWMGEHVEYQGHRLPLQPGSGSVLLNDGLQPVGDRLERFFWSWDFAAQSQDMALLGESLAAAKRNRRKHRRLCSNLERWRDDLQNILTEGWTDFGQTNALLKQIATFGRVFLGLSGTDLMTYVADRAIASPGYEQFCRHQHEIHRKAYSWARSVEGNYYPANREDDKMTGSQYPLEPAPNGNKERQYDATLRILKAMQTILSEGRYKTYETVTDWAEALVELAHCSMRTLYRHLATWHPDHSNTLAEFEARSVMPKDPYLSMGVAEALLYVNPENPYSRDRRDRLPNGLITDPWGGMKSDHPDEIHKKNLSPGGKGGSRGGGNLSTALEEV
ncbi:MAG: hypothetical protein AAF609_08465 [Cyanobacteria bacterium P01_C01_bin.120]